MGNKIKQEKWRASKKTRLFQTNNFLVNYIRDKKKAFEVPTQNIEQDLGIYLQHRDVNLFFTIDEEEFEGSLAVQEENIFCVNSGSSNGCRSRIFFCISSFHTQFSKFFLHTLIVLVYPKNLLLYNRIL